MGDSAKQQQTRHARRLYVGGIPPGTVEEDLSVYFNNVIARATAPTVLEGGPPVVQIYINPEKCFAFVELTSIELTTACLTLDGMKYDHRTGTSIIRVRRPNDFKPELMPTNLQPLAHFNLNVFGMANSVAEGPGKLFIGGLPYHLADEQVKELLMDGFKFSHPLVRCGIYHLESHRRRRARADHFWIGADLGRELDEVRNARHQRHSTTRAFARTLRVNVAIHRANPFNGLVVSGRCGGGNLLKRQQSGKQGGQQSNQHPLLL